MHSGMWMPFSQINKKNVTKLKKQTFKKNKLEKTHELWYYGVPSLLTNVTEVWVLPPPHTLSGGPECIDFYLQKSLCTSSCSRSFCLSQEEGNLCFRSSSSLWSLLPISSCICFPSLFSLTWLGLSFNDYPRSRAHWEQAQFQVNQYWYQLKFKDKPSI